MFKELESMNLSEYRLNAQSVLRDYRDFIPWKVYESALFDIMTAQEESTITRVLRTCRNAL